MEENGCRLGTYGELVIGVKFTLQNGMCVSDGSAVRSAVRVADAASLMLLVDCTSHVHWRCSDFSVDGGVRFLGATSILSSNRLSGLIKG